MHNTLIHLRKSCYCPFIISIWTEIEGFLDYEAIFFLFQSRHEGWHLKVRILWILLLCVINDNTYHASGRSYDYLLIFIALSVLNLKIHQQFIAGIRSIICGKYCSKPYNPFDLLCHWIMFTCSMAKISWWFILYNSGMCGSCTTVHGYFNVRLVMVSTLAWRDTIFR